MVDVPGSKSQAPLDATILHITTRASWEEALSAGVYRGDTLESDGFIHCSTQSQVIDVANEWFRGQNGLLLLHINARRLKAEIRYEGVPRGDLFPDVYGPINLDAVTSVSDLAAGEDGRFHLPGSADFASG